MTILVRSLTLVGFAFFLSNAPGQGDPAGVDPPRSVRNQLIQSGSSLASLDFTGDCVPTMKDFAVYVYLTIKDKGLLGVDTDGDGELTANDTIEQIRQIVAASVVDPDRSGVTDTEDIAEVLNDAIVGQHEISSDITQDSSVDGEDIIAVRGAIGRENVIDFDRATYMIYAAIGDVAPAVDAGVYGWHTAQTDAGCGGFGGDNWPDDDNHATRTSRLIPVDHAQSTSRLYPGNHSVGISSEWPDPVPVTPCLFGDCLEWPDDVDSWPANHRSWVSSTWDDGPSGEHQVHHSQEWADKPGHAYEVSSGLPDDHFPETSNRWPANHTAASSGTLLIPDPDNHIEWTSIRWEHNTGVSGKWPPNHDTDLSGSWEPHAVAWSTSWPPNHNGMTSSDWPSTIYPNWPPNHRASISIDEQAEGPPIPTTIFPPDHTYFITLRDILQIPFPDFPWPPPMGDDGGDDDGGDDGGDGGVQ